MLRRGAFTLLELVVVLVIIATVASMVIPRLSDDRRLRLIAASSLLASDIELAQVMTISKPESAVVVRMDPSESRYWLAYAAAPDTPLTRDDNGEAYLVVMGAGRASGAIGVTFSVDEMNDNTLEFSPHGGVADFTSEPTITLMADDIGVRLTISTMTGTITETELAAGDAE